MKRIVLKPECSLSVDETYLMNGEKCNYLGCGENKGQLEFRGANGKRFWIWSSEIKDIIESPEEQEKRLQSLEQALDMANHKLKKLQYDHELLVDKVGYIAADSPDEPEHVVDTNKMIDQVADAGKAIENIKDLVENQQEVPPEFDKIFKENFSELVFTDEKPPLKLREIWTTIHEDGSLDTFTKHEPFEEEGENPDLITTPEDKLLLAEKIIKEFHAMKSDNKLKLRVGGVYKDREGTLVKIVRIHSWYDESELKFRAEDNDVYREDGSWMPGNNYTEHRFDLIEEVQPEQANETLCLNKFQVKEKEAVEYCECLNPDVIFSCDNCKKIKISGLVNVLLRNRDADLRLFLSGCSDQRLLELFSVFNAELDKRNPKQSEGNPFKVGEKIRVHECYQQSPIPYVWEGEVKNIIGNCIYFDQTGKWYHYKQCERVD